MESTETITKETIQKKENFIDPTPIGETLKRSENLKVWNKYRGAIALTIAFPWLLAGWVIYIGYIMATWND